MNGNPNQGMTYDLNLNWLENIAANGGIGQTSTRIDVAFKFVVTSITGTIWIPTPSGGAIAMTPFARGSSPTVGSNTFPCVDACTVQLTLNDGSWQQSPVRFGNFAGTAERPYYPNKPIEFAGGASLLGALQNFSPFPCQAQVTLRGYKL